MLTLVLRQARDGSQHERKCTKVATFAEEKTTFFDERIQVKCPG